MKSKILMITAIIVLVIAIIVIITNSNGKNENTNINTNTNENINSNTSENISENENPNKIVNTAISNNTSSQSKTSQSAKTINGEFDENGNLIIKIEDLDTSNVTFIKFEQDNLEMELVAIKDEDDNIDVAFNTCQVCNGSPKAYFIQKNGKLICENCENTFSFKTIGQNANGCNPMTLNDSYITKSDDGITVNADYLKQNSNLFENVAKH